MKRHKMKETLKKIGAASAAVCLAALFFIMLAVSGHTAPENPMEDKDADASRMYLTSSTLAMDETQLADVENANINTGEEGNKEAQKEKEKEQEEDQAEQGEMQQEDDNAQENQREHANADTSDPSLSTPSKDSLLALIDKHKNDPSNPSQGGEGPGTGEGDNGNPGDGGPGGNGNKPTEGGEAITLNPEQSSLLFTTNLKNEIVDKQEYDLRIKLTEKGKQLNLVSQEVTLNNSSSLYQNGMGIKLKKGENTVSVKLRFRDKTDEKNQIDAFTPTYIITYVSEEEYHLKVQVSADPTVILKDGDNYTVNKNNISLLVTAKQGTKDIKARVRLNRGSYMELDPSDRVCNLEQLNVGENTVNVQAGSGGGHPDITFTITYKTETESLQFEGKGPDGGDGNELSDTVESSSFTGSKVLTYTASTTKFYFRISLSTGQDRITKIEVGNRIGWIDKTDQKLLDRYIECDLDASVNTQIKVTFMDSNNQKKHYIWEIEYVRNEDGNLPDNNKKVPYIDPRNLGDNETVHESPYTFAVAFSDHNGAVIRDSKQFKVYLNGEPLVFSGISGGDFEFTLYLTEGINHIRIELTDYEQYKATKDLTVTFSPDKQSAQVHMILSANVLGLGTMIDEYVTVPADQTVAQVVNDRLQAYGYTPIYQGIPTDASYFLDYIEKKGILDGWSISDEQREMYEWQGITIEDPASNDSLGKNIFASGSSGWMVTQNNRFIGQSMGVFGIRDRDVIQVMFTINNGADINVDPNSGDY